MRDVPVFPLQSVLLPGMPVVLRVFEPLAVIASGGARFDVVAWHDDDPHPAASVRLLPDLPWSEELRPVLERTERTVRRALAAAGEFGVVAWPPHIALDDDPALRAWQLAGIAPLGPLDHLALLGAQSFADLLERLAELTVAAEETLPLTADLDFPFDDGNGDGDGDGDGEGR